ncbi:MAG: NAD-glutamate dehydrogenase [Pseudomonadota bacterium]
MPDAPPTSKSLLDEVRTQVSREAANENASTLSDEDLDSLSEALTDWVCQQESAVHAIRTRAVPGHPMTALEAAGPDMPFLVDSLLNVCAAEGLAVRALFHPIVDVGSGLKSAIHIQLPSLSPAESARLVSSAEAALTDVRAAVSDYAAMRELMAREADSLSASPHVSQPDRDEAVAFLTWLAREHFVFLGARSYVFETGSDGNILPEEPIMVERSNLGVLRDEALNVLARGAEPALLTPEIGAFLQEPDPLIIAKSTLVSRVHRPVFADYVGIKRYDETGRVIGETRFAGLFTAEAYDETARSIPLIRRRVAQVIDASGATAGGHSAKALSNLLETWPRDELFQTDAETLTPMLLGALHLIGRPRARLFVREDRFGRFVSPIVYIPRDAYDSDLRQRIGALLEDRYSGRIITFQPSFDAGPLARVHFHIAVSPGGPQRDVASIEAEIARMAETWDDGYRAALAQAKLDEVNAAKALAFRGAFNAGYREAFSADEAIIDVRELAALSANAPMRVRAYRLDGDEGDVLRAKIYSRNGSVPLSECVPILENMGLFTEFEIGYPVSPDEKQAEDAPDTYWIHTLSMRTRSGANFDLDATAPRFQDAFVDIWRGHAENDAFNKLILAASLSSREASLIRALSAFRAQTGQDPARSTQARAFAAHPNLTRSLLALFNARFDPDAGTNLDTRAADVAHIETEIEDDLKSVAALDEDRVIRRTAALINAILRTNFFQTGTEGRPPEAIAFKIDSNALEALPAPKPYREIFVCSPEVEGCHLRFGPVARGGLRWSDRRDDFRTEVLGLVKAQQVKNAVIVPVGSKGGFYPKRLPIGGSRDAVREAGISAYRSFISNLLALTDNLVEGRVIPPEDTVIWDGDDPYLVVAADKGTATFSDIANEISESQGFWLGDAFASGGSAGYDHKKMGITARGGWEAVKRHFREIGKDIQSEPFTVIGVGDMSGDVFGNGMLLSKQIRLLAAFNHLHIFLDPDPQDPQRAWEERKRIFDLPRSGWSDYDLALISDGGGVFRRTDKAISLNDQIRGLTGLGGDQATPDEIITALLQADAELLWFGGIGTYVKAASETHAQVGDRANDSLRVDAGDLGARVVGEGANLGMTQAARIEFALNGGRVNTDAIDNSAGVDSSDHEVNIKILATEAIERGALPTGERNILLSSMTDDVAEHVLRHNYDQTGALTLAQVTAALSHEANERLMAYLESRGVLDRKIEGLPSSEAMRSRGEVERWLSRPELAVLMAWTKIVLFDDLVASDLPDDPYFKSTLTAYFPEAIRSYPEAISAHRLKREIIATVVANRTIDAAGPLVLLRLKEMTGAHEPEIVRAVEAARILLNFEQFRSEVDALDNVISADAQSLLRLDGAAGLSRAAAWLVRNEASQAVSETLDAYNDGLSKFKARLRETASAYASARIERRARALMRRDVPEDLARWSASISNFAEGLSIVQIANTAEAEVKGVSSIYFDLGDQLRLDRLRASAEDGLANAPYWDRVAARRLIVDLENQQANAAEDALAHGGDAQAWIGSRSADRNALLQTLRDLGRGHHWSFSKFALSADAVRQFLALGR